MDEFKIQLIDAANHQSAFNQALLRSLIGIQKEHFYDASIEQSGFFVTEWSMEEITALLLAGSVIHVAVTSNQALAAYVVISPIEEFTKQLTSAEHTFDTTQINERGDWLYLYQIGVAAKLTNRKIGTSLLGRVLKQYPNKSFFSDYMIRPRVNRSSEHLFRRLGFNECGMLDLEAYRGFEPSTWQLVKFNYNEGIIK